MLRILYYVQEGLRLLFLRFGIKHTSFFPIRSLQRRYCSSVRKTFAREFKPIHRVLVLSQLSDGSTSHSRFKALQSIFELTEGIDVLPYILSTGWEYVVANQFYSGDRVRALNDRVVDQAKRLRPDLVWVDRGLYLWPATLEALRSISNPLMIHYSPDNHQVAGNQSRHYFRTLPLYDVHVTTKPAEVSWLKSIGAARVELLDKAYDPELHRPLALSSEDRQRYGCDVGFVGHWERPREELLLWLKSQGVSLRVWGGGWERAREKNHPLFRHAPHLVGDAYAKAIQGAKIQLCLVSQWFHDRTTARSIEIPACGTFMLAERTTEHQALFKEGVEVELYSTREELFEKIQYYLSHEAERQTIAAAGLVRCRSGYRSEDRLRELFKRLGVFA